MSVAVIGAGPAGLAAACRLAVAGVGVTLYDREPRPGGRMRTETLDGARADVAVQLLGSYYRKTLRLAAAAGADGLLVRSPGRDALWRGGRAHTITYGSVTSMAASGALPARLKLRLAAKYVPFLTRHAAALDANDPAAAAAAGLDGESIAEWGRRELGADFVELLAYPQLSAYYGATPEETGAGFYHGLARAGLDVSLRAVRGGMAALAGAIVGAVEARGGSFRGGTPVDAVRPTGAGVEVRSGGVATAHAAAVLAVPAAAVAAVTPLDGPAGKLLSAVRTSPASSLTLLLDRPTPASYFGLSFPRTEPPGDRVVAVCVQERKAPGLVPAGKGLLTVYPAPAIAAEIAEGTLDQALDRLLPAIEDPFPGIGRHIAAAHLARFPEGGAVFYPGYAERLRRFDPAALPPALALAGEYLVAPTVEGAVRSGIGAAERLLRGVLAAAP